MEKQISNAKICFDDFFDKQGYGMPIPVVFLALWNKELKYLMPYPDAEMFDKVFVHNPSLIT